MRRFIREILFLSIGLICGIIITFIFNENILIVASNLAKIILLISLIAFIVAAIFIYREYLKEGGIRKNIEKYIKFEVFLLSTILFLTYYVSNEKTFINTYSANPLGIDQGQYIFMVNFIGFFILYQLVRITMFSNYYIKSLNKDGIEFSKEEVVNDFIEQYYEVSNESNKVRRQFQDIIEYYDLACFNLQNYLSDLVENNLLPEEPSFDEYISFIRISLKDFLGKLDNCNYEIGSMDKFRGYLEEINNFTRLEINTIVANVSDTYNYCYKEHIFIKATIDSFEADAFIHIDTIQIENIYPFEIGILVVNFITYFENVYAFNMLSKDS